MLLRKEDLLKKYRDGHKKKSSLFVKNRKYKEVTRQNDYPMQRVNKDNNIYNALLDIPNQQIQQNLENWESNSFYKQGEENTKENIKESKKLQSFKKSQTLARIKIREPLPFTRSDSTPKAIISLKERFENVSKKSSLFYILPNIEQKNLYKSNLNEKKSLKPQTQMTSSKNYLTSENLINHQRSTSIAVMRQTTKFKVKEPESTISSLWRKSSMVQNISLKMNFLQKMEQQQQQQQQSIQFPNKQLKNLNTKQPKTFQTKIYPQQPSKQPYHNKQRQLIFQTTKILKLLNSNNKQFYNHHNIVC